MSLNRFLEHVGLFYQTGNVNELNQHKKFAPTFKSRIGMKLNQLTNARPDIFS